MPTSASTPLGEAVGCVGAAAKRRLRRRSEAASPRPRRCSAALALTPDQAAKHGLTINRDGRKRSAYELLAYPEIDFAQLASIWPELRLHRSAIATQIATNARYSVYVKRQELDIAAFRKDEGVAIPNDFVFAALPGLSTELRHKLERNRPETLGKAARLDGMTPAALMLLLAHLKKGQAARSA